MKVSYTYHWSLSDAEAVHVRSIMEQLRLHALEFASDVSNVIVLTGAQAHAVQPEAKQLVMFTATIAGTSSGRYGLASSEVSSWSWSGAVVVSSMRTVSEFHKAAARLGIDVIEGYAGMVFTSKKNGRGLVETEQQAAFDWSNF
jgi:hypothetical protein